LFGILSVVLLVGFLAFRPDKLFVDDVVDESLSQAFAASTTSTTVPSSTVPSDGGDPNETSTTTTTTVTPATTDPIAVSSGAFYGIDHAASGTATIYEQSGSYVLRFEDDTDIQNGPDLYVWLLPTADYQGTPKDYIDLGKIKGNVGGQNYVLPPEFDPEFHRSVLIWCLRFSVPFAAAPLV
jgi:hypothetical protein